MFVKGCIFDLDGVLCETSYFHFLAWQRTAEALGIAFTEKDNEHLKGVSRVGSLKYILELGGVTLEQNEFDEWLTRKNELYLSMIDGLRPEDCNEGVIPFLEDLKRNGVGIALGSSSKNARRVLDALEISHYFDAIVDGNDVLRSKPDPEVFQKGAAQMGMKPGECVVFEDAPMGLLAARNGGFISIAVGGEELLEFTSIQIPDMKGLSFDKINSMVATYSL